MAGAEQEEDQNIAPPLIKSALSDRLFHVKHNMYAPCESHTSHRNLIID